MTAAATTEVGSKDGLFSTAHLSRMAVQWWYNIYVLIKFMVGVAGAGAIAVADTYIGGVVLVDVLAKSGTTDGRVVGWALSIATSGVLLALWGFIFARKRIRWLLVLPALGVMAIDVVVDARYPTLKLYGLETVMSSGLVPPEATFMWKLLEALIIGVTVFGEGLILLIFMWLHMELQNLRQGKRPAAVRQS